MLFKLLMSEQYNKTLITAGVLYRFGKMITRKVKVVSCVDLHSPSCDRHFVVILHGHCIIESPGPSEGLERTCVKCYTVNDISFDPNQYAFYHRLEMSLTFTSSLGVM